METVSVALICTIASVAISYAAFTRNKDSSMKQEIKQETKEEALTTAKLDYISKGVDDIRLDIRAQDRKINDINDRLIRAEESTKSAHKRLNDMEENLR
jgi:septal ring factor EnvC (AmiA/AmiB activator)